MACVFSFGDLQYEMRGLVPHGRIVGSSQNHLLTSSTYTTTTRAFGILKLSRDMQQYLNTYFAKIQGLRASFEDETVDKGLASNLRTATFSVWPHLVAYRTCPVRSRVPQL
jgi:hypothetical protein